MREFFFHQDHLFQGFFSCYSHFTIFYNKLRVCPCAGNILCVWVFNKKDVELKPSFANLLKCLSIYDILLLVSCHFYCSLTQSKSQF